MVSARSTVLQPVIEDLRRVFGNRLEAMVAYGWRQHGPVPSLALVQSIAVEDLDGCAARTAAWRRGGAATPLLLTTSDFVRSLDAFPIEYGEIMATHDVLFGRNPFDGLAIRPEDLRRACEVQAKSHLLHLRENYLEGGARPAEVDTLVRESAAAFVALLRHLARLDDVAVTSLSHLTGYATDRIGLNALAVSDLLSLADPDGVPAIDTVKLFPAYLASVERLAEFVDRWREA